MNRLLPVLWVLLLTACAVKPPPPTAYADAPRTPINGPVLPTVFGGR